MLPIAVVENTLPKTALYSRGQLATDWGTAFALAPATRNSIYWHSADGTAVVTLARASRSNDGSIEIRTSN